MRKSIEASPVKDDTLSGCMVGRYSIGGGTRGPGGHGPPPDFIQLLSHCRRQLYMTACAK